MLLNFRKKKLHAYKDYRQKRIWIHHPKKIHILSTSTYTTHEHQAKKVKQFQQRRFKPYIRKPFSHLVYAATEPGTTRSAASHIRVDDI
jgi:hypothetical protein